MVDCEMCGGWAECSEVAVKYYEVSGNPAVTRVMCEDCGKMYQ